MNEAQIFEIEGYKIHFNYEWTSERKARRYIICVLETERKNFYSGIAMSHPNESRDQRTGWRIALRRACQAYIAYIPIWRTLYRELWDEIRRQLRDQEMRERVAQ